MIEQTSSRHPTMLCDWSEHYRDAFAEMNRDALVTVDLGGPLSRAESDEKFDRYCEGWHNEGISRWAIVDPPGNFLGYVGVVKRTDASHPLGLHFEIGWRLRREAWGKGIATQCARSALDHAWTVTDVPEIFSYTAADNIRSQAVMRRLDLKRDQYRDFTTRYDGKLWRGLVWVADRPDTTNARINPPPATP